MEATPNVKQTRKPPSPSHEKLKKSKTHIRNDKIVQSATELESLKAVNADEHCLDSDGYHDSYLNSPARKRSAWSPMTTHPAKRYIKTPPSQFRKDNMLGFPNSHQSIAPFQLNSPLSGSLQPSRPAKEQLEAKPADLIQNSGIQQSSSLNVKIDVPPFDTQPLSKVTSKQGPVSGIRITTSLDKFSEDSEIELEGPNFNISRGGQKDKKGLLEQLNDWRKNFLKNTFFLGYNKFFGKDYENLANDWQPADKIWSAKWHVFNFQDQQDKRDREKAKKKYPKNLAAAEH